MNKGKGRATGNRLKVLASGDVPESQARAATVLRPAVQAALTVRRLNRDEMGDLALQALVDELGAQSRSASSGDLKRLEEMLATQATTLDALFGALTRRAVMNIGEHLGAAEAYMRLALKAQSQARATIETLAAVKNPPIVYARQANVTTGPQQVNNLSPDASPVRAPARETGTGPTQLLETEHGKWLDTRAAGAAGGGDTAMATLDQEHGPEVSGR